MVDSVITKSMKKTWIHGNADVLREHCSVSFEACCNAETIMEFWESASKYSGHEDFDEFCKHNNPMNFFQGIRCPTLVLNSLDDPVCVRENIRFDLAEQTENVALAVTTTGSHIAYVDGIVGESQWMTKICMEFMSHAYHDHLHQTV
mmetsp:Transcript_5870/g.7398  ORF Transcript_5870/g.7398 Transcript_5870/m.7398 type:complete len:147 (-) Transcript_5870:231-671(-)